MRIHIHNQTDDGNSKPTLQQFLEAAARAGDVGRDHVVSMGEADAELDAALREAEVLITTSRLIRRLLTADAPRLRLVFLTHAGVDALASPDIVDRLRGVRILNTSGAHAAKASEYGLMAVLALAQHLPAFATQQRQQGWSRHLSPVLEGRRVTIVGLGSIGAAIAEKLHWLKTVNTGVRTRAGENPHCRRVIAQSELDAVLPQTEFLILTCPLTPATSGMLDRRRIGLLPQHAGVVNLGRGELVEQEALLDALDAGRLSGAVLDVCVPEPLPPGHRLWHTPNLILTPHVSAGDPLTYIPRSFEIFFENLRCLRDGRPAPNEVDLARGY